MDPHPVPLITPTERTAEAVEPAGGFTPEELTRLRELAARVDDLRARIADLEAAKETATGELRDLLKVAPEAYPVGGGLAVSVTQSTRFDAAKATLVVPAAVLPLISTNMTVIDEAKAKALLAPVAFAACRSPHGKATITVKRVTP